MAVERGGLRGHYGREVEFRVRIARGLAARCCVAPFVRTGSLVFISGHIAKKNGKPWTGQLGATVTTGQGKEAARGIAIELLETLQAAVGNLNKIRRIVKLMVLVNSAPSFTEQHVVANGASELLGDVFLSQGAHARSAFGVAQIPFGSCVEIELVAEVV